MRKLKLGLSVLAILIGTVTVSAQEQKMTKEEKSEKRMGKMVEALGLNEEQAAKIKAVNADVSEVGEKLREEMKALKIKMKALKEKKKQLVEKRTESMKSILTDKQLIKYYEMKEKRKQKRMNKKEGHHKKKQK